MHHPSVLLRSRLALGVLLASASGLWLACGTPPVATVRPRVARTTASSATVASASATSALAVASAEPPRLPADCQGAQINLSVAMFNVDCTTLANPMANKPATTTPPLTVTAAARRPRLAPGEDTPIDVVFTNTSDAPVTLWMLTERMSARGNMWGADIGDPSDFGGPGLTLPPAGSTSARPSPSPSPPDPVAPPPEDDATLGFGSATTNLKGQDVDSPRLSPVAAEFGIIDLRSMNDMNVVQIQLAPHGKATATTVWVATGYNPAKTYRLRKVKGKPDEFPPPEPLAVGEYDVAMTFPSFVYGDGRWVPPTTKTRVRVAK